MKPPNGEMVGVAWLTWLKDQGVIAAPAATSRPDPAGWYGTGFLVVSLVGSAADPEGPGWRAPILSVDAWAYTPNGSRPPWDHAAGLAQLVHDAAEDGLVPPGPLALRTGYDRARIQTAWRATDIRRVVEPEGSSYAHYSVDVGLGWVRIPA